MGLLDDAIREHLELKRRRGADPAEIEQAEREALGPVRRGPDGGDDLEPLAEPGGEHLAYEEEEGWVADEGGLVIEEEQPYEHEFPHRQETWSAADAGLVDEPPSRHEELFESEPPPVPTPTSAPRPSAAPPLDPIDHLGVETQEFEVDFDEHEQHPDDMLEETPEFLQDTPDHDRLWFEQRPPRDFDFDG